MDATSSLLPVLQGPAGGFFVFLLVLVCGPIPDRAGGRASAGLQAQFREDEVDQREVDDHENGNFQQVGNLICGHGATVDRFQI